jgi:hypothetical protein
MATLILAAAGSAAGGAVGGGLAGIAAPALGQALGAIAGGVIDQRILGAGTRVVETGRLGSLRLQGSREGAAIPRVYGRMRLAGNVLWATRFRETASDSAQGGKGGAPRATVREFSYSVSLAVGLCEGPVARIGRIWADGRIFAQEDAAIRLHRGAADQPPDPLIEAVEGPGNAPAYRGTAYLVFEDLELARFGNRVPQFNVEVFRQPVADRSLSAEFAPPLTELVEAVALSPGSGEFALETTEVRRRLDPGVSVAENVNSAAGRPDLLVALDQLREEAPACRSVSLVVSWFGDDLRAGQCRIAPAVEDAAKATEPVDWRVGGLARKQARVVGRTPEGRPVFGGTPSDGGVIASIRELKARGMKVVFYPFILMDVAPGNTLPDPYGGAAQAAYPWRGRITLDAAPGQPGSADKTGAAAADVARFFGAARRGDFTPAGNTIRYDGAAEWSFRRFILHYAHLCAMAGGVDAFCLGSEMRGLTTIRSDGETYPAVAALRALAGDVRAILGAATKIGYAADWSEYFGHQPQDGSGDAMFHLDPLWADANVDFVGIDNYMPIADWRDGPDHADAARARSIYELSYLQSQIEGGEGFDWFYASDADRRAQRRTPIADGAHGEDWLFRYKDIRGWWSNPHHNRPGGSRAEQPTAWTPGSKPVWFTELGCPAVDKGANQPNVFIDPKSSESAAPHFSAGAADDHMQRRYLEATLSYWRDPVRNPPAPAYGGRMVDTSASHVWTWDARPWPDFPQRLNIWGDGDNHRLGHWITGRLGAAGLGELVAEICAESGLRDIDVSDLHDTVDGYAQEATQTGRQALQPLMLSFGFDAVESGGRVRFVTRGGAAAAGVAPADVAADATGDAPASSLRFTRATARENPAAVRLGYVASDAAYEASAAEARGPDGQDPRVETAETAVAMTSARAQTIADRWLAESALGREEATLALPPSRMALEPGDAVLLPTALGARPYRIDRVTERGRREIVARRVDASVHRSAPGEPRRASPPALGVRQPLAVALLDAPGIGGAAAHQPLIAAFAAPWPGQAAVYRSTRDDGYALDALIDRPATMGVLTADLPHGAPHRWMEGDGLRVRLFGGALGSRERLDVLNGANVAVIEGASDELEVIQFARADLIGPREYRLTGLLRGQAGTEPFIGAPTRAGARFVLLDGAPGTVNLREDERGLSRHYRVGPAHVALDDPSFVHFEAASAGAGLRPYAPARVRIRPGADGTLVATWIRRSRVGGDSWIDADPPLGEEREAYLVQVRRNGAVLRTVETAAPRFDYSLADQTADGAGAPFDIAVAQISARFGPGPETKVTFP